MDDPFCSTICWSFCLSPIDALVSFAENQMALAAWVYFRIVCSILIDYVSFVFYVSTRIFLNYHTQFNLEPDITIPPTLFHLLMMLWLFRVFCASTWTWGLIFTSSMMNAVGMLMKFSEAFFLLSTAKSSILLTALYLCVTHSCFLLFFFT